MRIEGWELALHQHIEDARDAEFTWGLLDCALWCADWIIKATGKDPAATWRGKYGSESEANELLQSMGFTSHEQVADATGLKVIPTAFAQRGDVVLNPQDCLGICDGVASYFLMAQDLIRFPTLECKKAWKVE